MRVSPILLAGGAGTRLWPISRRSFPKQFAKLLGDRSLFQDTMQRFQSTKDVEYEKPVVFTNDDYRFIVKEQAENIGQVLRSIIIEPFAKNTAPAIIAASLMQYQNDKDSVLFVAPTDHHIGNIDRLTKLVKLSKPSLIAGNILTFGIVPTYAETGYGYIQCKDKFVDRPLKVKRFIEKPDLDLANTIFAKGGFFWNSGMFLFRAVDMIEAFRRYEPKILNDVQAAINSGQYDLDFFRLNEDKWKSCESQSIDYAIMEKVDNLEVLPFDGEWSDLGDWKSIWANLESDDSGVSLFGNSHSYNCTNTLLYSGDDKVQLFGIGLTDIVAVATADAIMVVKKDQTQMVKEITSDLKKLNLGFLEDFSSSRKPWGRSELLASFENCKVNSLSLYPGQKINRQTHSDRSEHWTVVEGWATFEINEKSIDLHPGRSIFAPPNVEHSIRNAGDGILKIIEIQYSTGQVA